MGTLTPTYRYLSLAVKYISVLFPFDAFQFVRVLAKQGFILSEQIRSVPPVPVGQRLEIGGIVGRRAEVSVRIDTQRQVLAVDATNVNTALAEMDSIESLLKNEFALDSSSLAQYYEFLADLTIRAKKNPLESWYAHFTEMPIMKEFSEVLGTEVSPFGVRLAIRGEVPNQINWFDIRIEPLLLSAKSHHSIEVVFRHSHRDDVFAFVRRFEDIVRDLLSLVEEG